MADDENKTENSNGETSEADSSPDKPSGTQPPRPPKAFWWRALLMIGLVIFLFSTIRDLANGQPSRAGTRAPDTADSSVLPLVNGENVTIEEAPSLPPSETIAPTPGYYYYPYPSPCVPRPGQGDGTVPAYPSPPKGGYAYPSAPQYPWYPPRYPWYAPYPPMGYGYPPGPGVQTPNNPYR